MNIKENIRETLKITTKRKIEKNQILKKKKNVREKSRNLNID